MTAPKIIWQEFSKYLVALYHIKLWFPPINCWENLTWNCRHSCCGHSVIESAHEKISLFLSLPLLPHTYSLFPVSLSSLSVCNSAFLNKEINSKRRNENACGPVRLNLYTGLKEGPSNQGKRAALTGPKREGNKLLPETSRIKWSPIDPLAGVKWNLCQIPDTRDCKLIHLWCQSH